MTCFDNKLARDAKEPDNIYASCLRTKVSCIWAKRRAFGQRHMPHEIGILVMHASENEAKATVLSTRAKRFEPKHVTRG